MEQLFFPNELRGRFFLKTPKSKKPSVIVFATRINGKLYKFTTGMKIYPHQWSQPLQRAYISSILTSADNRNNSVINKQIDEISDSFIKFKQYLCYAEDWNTTNTAAQLKNLRNTGTFVFLQSFMKMSKKENANS